MSFDLIVDSQRLRQMSQAAQQFAQSEGGATQKTLALIRQHLPAVDFATLHTRQ
jgi:hypothetical protein